MGGVCLDACFFFNDTATTEIYTLSLHDALPISEGIGQVVAGCAPAVDSITRERRCLAAQAGRCRVRSEEHTSELQSRPHISYAVFCLKKKNNTLE